MEPTNEYIPVNIPQKAIKGDSKKYIFLLLGFFIIITGALLVIILKPGVINKPEVNNKPSPPPLVHDNSLKQWVNCDDVRDVIEENEKIYTACLGGVIVVDKKSGRVVDQITRSHGLSSNTTTSLIKKGNILYIGTQDGFTKFDLKTRTAKKFSVNEGLVNGANIILAEDGDIIWVGTFNGLSRFNIKSEEIINYTTELADGSSSYSISNLLVTPNALYVSVLANANSRGSIARFDKDSKTWERFGPDSFAQNGEYARIDFFKISRVNDLIIVSSSKDDTWMSRDIKNSPWEKLVIDKNSAENEQLNLINSNSDKLYLVNNSALYSYDINNSKYTKLFPTSESDKDIFYNNGFSSIFKNNKIWNRNNSKKAWLSWYDVKSNTYGKINIQDRPINIQKILGAIDGNPIIAADSSLWQYDSRKNKFSIIDGDFSITVETPPDSIAFYPIPNSKFILLFSQLCGQGCFQPQLSILDYTSKKNEQVIFSDNVLKAISSEPFDKSTPIFNQLIFDSYDKASQVFKFFTRYDKTQIAAYNLKSKQWILTDTSPTINSDINSIPITCNFIFMFAVNNKFESAPCSKTLETDQYNLKIIMDDKNAVLSQRNKNTGIEEEIILRGAEPEYSPFVGFDNTAVYTARMIKEIVWIATNRGLIKYDPKTKSMKSYTTEDGLISNEVTTFLVADNYIWTVTNWGGLSRIPQ